MVVVGRTSAVFTIQATPESALRSLKNGYPVYGNLKPDQTRSYQLYVANDDTNVQISFHIRNKNLSETLGASQPLSRDLKPVIEFHSVENTQSNRLSNRTNGAVKPVQVVDT